nr:hypothetical protein [Microlunatus speluncae]
MVAGEIVDGPACEQLIESGNQIRAFGYGMLIRAAHSETEEDLRATRTGDQGLQPVNLILGLNPPLGAGLIQHHRCGVQRQAELVDQLNEREPAQLTCAVHPPACPPCGWGHQAASLVIAQR